MAKILYGVAGEGSGHSMRAKEVINYLLEKGHRVEIVSYDKGHKNLSKKFKVHKINGLNFVYKENGVKYFATFVDSINKLPKLKKSISKVLNIIEDFEPDIIFTDFEPMTCLAGHIKKLPIISIDNQHRLTNTEVSYPRKYIPEANAAKAVVKLIIWKANEYIVTAFHVSKTLNKKTHLITPIIREEVLKAKTFNKKHILVYFTSHYKKLFPLFNKFEKTFIIYGFNKNKKKGNLIFKKDSKSFIKDLAGCDAIIASAGFTLITEALYLQKPYLAMAVKGQFEQVFNAYNLEKLGFGKYEEELTEKELDVFFNNIPKYKKNLKKYKKSDNSDLLKVLDSIIEKYT